MMDEKFTELHTNFMEKYYRQFENIEENKLEYMDIFRSYNEIIEKFIEDELCKKLPRFKMVEFEKELM